MTGMHWISFYFEAKPMDVDTQVFMFFLIFFPPYFLQQRLIFHHHVFVENQLPQQVELMWCQTHLLASHDHLFDRSNMQRNASIAACYRLGFGLGSTSQVGAHPR